MGHVELNVDGSMSRIDLSFEYRFYPTSDTHFPSRVPGLCFLMCIHEVGSIPSAFRDAGFASHSGFSVPYYVGLEDDYDMGISFDIKPAQHDLSLAYFRQAEPAGPGADPLAGRYSYDIIPGNGAFVNSEGKVVANVPANLTELNQFNARLVWHFADNWQVGLSAQAGENYNATLDKSKLSTAFAGHIEGDFGGFNLKAEVIRYDYRALGDEGQDLDVVPMGNLCLRLCRGAKGIPVGWPPKRTSMWRSLAYTIPVNWGPITSISPISTIRWWTRMWIFFTIPIFSYPGC